MNAFSRKLSVAAVSVVAALGVLGLAGPADAAVPYPAIFVVSQTNDAAGVTFSLAETRCLTNHYLQLDPYLGGYFEARDFVISADAPGVYARNVTSGVDRGYVASRIRLLDRSTNQITYGAFSPWTLAADNAPFRAGTTTFRNLNLSHVYATQQEMWWYNANGTISKLVVQLTQYRQLTLSNNYVSSNTIQANCVIS
jgi:hypothetical protein